MIGKKRVSPQPLTNMNAYFRFNRCGDFSRVMIVDHEGYEIATDEVIGINKNMNQGLNFVSGRLCSHYPFISNGDA